MISLVAYLYLGPYDCVVLGILAILNIVFWRKNIPVPTGCLITILFAVILPLISMLVEINRSAADNGPAMDAFELLYTYFRFPVYWAIGIIQAIIFFIIKSLQKRNPNESL